MKKNYKKETILKNYQKILIVIMPIVPHLSNECLKSITNEKDFIWPKYNEKLLIEEFVNIVVQINGKKRGILKTKRNIGEDEIFKLIKNEEKIFKYIGKVPIKKKIFISNKLINIII